MSNSSLVSYQRLSPNKTNGRKHRIDTITIHCMAGNLSVETCGNVFANPKTKASSNYGIGSDGRIAMYVEERDRSWATSSSSNDNRAVTIEVANDGGAPNWHVSDKALASLIRLVADICKRNGIKKLLWKNDKSLIGQVDKQNMTVHRWFANKACPGDYLMSKHSYIAAEVNKLLGGGSSSEPSESIANTISFTTLRKGSKGSAVKTLQINLNKVISAGLVVDGDYGIKTYNAVIKFQKQYGLVADGIYGTKSNEKMEDVLKNSQSTAAKVNGYKIKVTARALNVRKHPSMSGGVAQVIHQNEIYTIVEEKNGWGKLKSDAGWIMLKYTKRV
jgi:hypothetical protein